MSEPTRPYEPLTSENAALVLIDHQVGLMTGVRDYSTGELKHNVVALAKAAKALKLPIIVTTTLGTVSNQGTINAAGQSGSLAEDYSTDGDGSTSGAQTTNVLVEQCTQASDCSGTVEVFRRLHVVDMAGASNNSRKVATWVRRCCM